MSAGSLPSELTRGYSKSFKDMLVERAPKPLTTAELEALDALEISPEFARGGFIRTVESEDETATGS